MRALLIYPEFPLSFWSFREALQFRGKKAICPPLGLLTVAALLPAAWELRLADLNTRRLTDDDWQWADLVLISAMYIQREGLVALVAEAKHRGKTVVVGGAYPTSLPETALEAGGDFVVRGEGESTIPLLLEALREGKTGVIENDAKPDLTASPIPRFDLLRLEDYDTLTIQTSRGCPFDCEFCDVVSLFGRKPRYKTPQQVIAELECLHRLGATGSIFFCDDNFIGSKKHARAILHELTPWLQSRGESFYFFTQVSINLGQDLELIDRMTEANLGKVFIGIESPDAEVLETSRKFHNLKNPMVESINNLKKNGVAVMGSFIIGLDGEAKGAGERICAFMEKTDIPVAMLGVLQAPPHSSLWHRLEREGRLKGDVGQDGGTFSALNYEPDRPEAEIMQEYAEAWNYLYEPSRFLGRAYRYYLAMRPTRRAQRSAPGPSPPGGHFFEPGMTWRTKLVELRAFSKILWSQGVRASYRRQFWTQMLGMLRRNPSRFVDYVVTCAMGQDLYYLRQVVSQKVAAMAHEPGREAPAAPFQGHPAVR
jgi:radical SAM superfamily enzyme YgiQ (UPF0313 family)